MFSAIRKARALFPSYTAHHTQSLASNADDLPLDERTVIDEDPDLWKDYSAVGFNIRGDLQCSTKNDCWD